MEIKIYNNVFENEYKTFEYDTTKPLLEQLEEHIEKNTYRETLVECYDPQTGETFYAPMLDEEIENPSVMIVVDGKSVDKDYQPKEGELVSVIFLPASKQFVTIAAGTIIGAGVGITLAGLLLMPFAGGMFASAAMAMAPQLFGILGLSGAVIGGLAGLAYYNSHNSTKDNGKQGTQSPDVRGAENSSIRGENFAFVIGKHLVSPRIIGDPVTEYSGHNGEDAYIRVLYQVGYAPLKLTEFKLGEFMLAYNRDHKIGDGTTVECGTYVSGHLKGYSRGNVPDSGDIVDYWKNNDIELEIIQQPNTTGEAITIDDYYQNNTAIDLANRPQVSAATMQAAGWDVPSGETCTVYSVAYSNENKTKTVLVTPINPDGTVLTPAQLDEVADDCLVPSQPIVATVNFNISDSPIPYGNRYLVNSLKVSLNAVMSSSVELQVQLDGAWTSVLTVPSGAISATLSEKPRWSGYVCRIKIGSWISDSFNAIGVGSENITTPETEYAPEHPQNLLATFTGTDSVEQSDVYAEGLHENQEAFYNQGHYSDGVNYGHIYTSTYDDQQINANLFYIADKELDENAKVVYKGSEFPNKFRTNGVFFTAACPMEFTITLDFQSGIYDTYTKTQNNTTTTKYDPIPLYLCVQWRIYNSNNKSSDPTGKDYDDWNTIQIGTMKTLNETNALADKNKHKGNDFGNKTLEDIYGGFYGKQVSDFSSYSGEDGISEIRVSKTITLTKAQCKEILADTNKGRLIEVRVLRVSPNYMNMVSDEGLPDGESTHSYSDHVKVTSILTKVFDEDKLKKEDTLVDIKPLSDDDYKKFCLVAIKAKADASGYLSQQLKNLSCIAESFSPIWDFNTKKVLPENITGQTKYFGYFENNQRVNRSSDDGVEEREVTKSEYEEARRDGFNWYAQDCGTNFASVMKGIVFKSENCYTHNDSPAYKLTEDAAKYNNNTAASGFLLGCVGPQNGPISVGYDGINLAAIGEWAEKTIALTDGSTFDADTVYNGVQYHKDDLIPVRMEANGYIYAATKLEDLLQKLAFCGRAAWYVDENGKISVIMDGPVDYTKGVINAQNCISSSNAFSYEEPPAGLYISFSDENDGYQTNQFYCWSDGNSPRSYHGQVEPYSIEFVTNPYQIWSLGRYLLALREMNREVLTRKIGVEGTTYKIGDVVLLQSEDLMIGDCSGRIQEVIEDDDYIYGFVCNSPYEYNAEQGEGTGCSTQGVTIMQPRYYGKSNAVTLPISMPRTQSVGDKSYTLAKGTTNLVLFKQGLAKGDNDPSPTQDVKYNFKTGDICMFGLRDYISAPYRITKIKPEKDGTFTQTLIPYDEGLYNAGAQIPSFQSFMPPPVVEEAPVSLNEVPTTLKEQNDTLQNVYNAIGVINDPTPPALPSSISIAASRDFISLAWINTSQNVKHTIIEMSKQNGDEGTWTQVAVIDSDNWRYNFNRSTDGYPEADSGTNKLSTWKFRFKNVSMCDVESAFTIAQSVTYTNYGTWIPATPSFTSKIPSEGGITFNWSEPTGQGGRTLYGTQKYTVTVKYEDTEHSVSEITLGTIVTNTVSAVYNFNRASNKDGYPEVTATANYKGLNKYKFTISVENESGGQPVSSAVSTFSNSETNLYGTWIPTAPVLRSAVAEETGIAIEWDSSKGVGNRQLYGGVSYKYYVHYDETGSSFEKNYTTDALSGFYTFTRTGTDSDGYPEKPNVSQTARELDKYKVKLEATNTVATDYTRTTTGTESVITYADYKTWIPSAPVITKCIAEEDGITFEWDDPSDCYGTNYYTISIPDAEGVIPQSLDSTRFYYAFLRSAVENSVTVVKDGYPEASDLVNWGFTVTAINTQSQEDNDVTDYVDISEYLGWQPNAPVVEPRSSGRTSTIASLNREHRYGKIMYKIMVCNPAIDYDEQGGERTYKYYLPVPTSDPYGAETNYKGNAEAVPPVLPQQNVPILTGSSYSQTMPLKDQTATKYKRYRFKFEYLEVNPQGTENPQEEGWYEYVYSYDAVTPVGTENPQEEGWYEYDGSDYVLTTDTTVDVGKTYYEKNGSYVQTADTTVDASKTYYEPNYYKYDTGSNKLLIYTSSLPPSSATQHDVYIDGVLVEDAYCWTETENNEMVNYISFEVSMPSPIDTTYWWKIAAYNAITESLQSKTSSYTDAQTVAFATSAYDVVKAGITENALAPDAVTMDKIAAGSITAQKILVESLAAISANLGAITDGSLVGSQNNYWYLSDEYNDQHELVHRAGDFRVGGASGDYISCTTLNGNDYHVEIQASQFNITAIGTVVKGEFYVSPTDAVINPSTGVPDKYFAVIGNNKIRYNLGTEYTKFEVGEISQGYELTFFQVQGGNHWKVMAGGFTTDGFTYNNYSTNPFFVQDPDSTRFFSANSSDISTKHSVPIKTVEVYKGDFQVVDYDDDNNVDKTVFKVTAHGNVTAEGSLKVAKRLHVDTTNNVVRVDNSENTSNTAFAVMGYTNAWGQFDFFAVNPENSTIYGLPARSVKLKEATIRFYRQSDNANTFNISPNNIESLTKKGKITFDVDGTDALVNITADTNYNSKLRTDYLKVWYGEEFFGDLSMGDSNNPKKIIVFPNSVSWYQGRDYAKIKQGSYTGYNPFFSIKTTNGTWELGPYTDNKLHFSYITDTNYNNRTNTQTADIILNPNGTIGASITGSSASCTGNAATASAVKDSGNNSSTTFAYSKTGLDTTSWFAAWSGYELRAIAPEKAHKTLIGSMTEGTSDVTDGTMFVSSYASNNGFSDSNAVNVPYKRKFSAVWNYIKGKISSVLGLTASSYGGSADKVDGYHVSTAAITTQNDSLNSLVPVAKHYALDGSSVKGGYIVFSNKLMICWGCHFNSGGNVGQTINYTTESGGCPSFASATNYIVNATYYNTESGTYYYAPNVKDKAVSSFKLTAHSDFNANTKFYWMAIGYVS